MPAPVVSRLISVTYAGLEVGGTTNYQILGLHELEGDYTARTLIVDVLVRDTTTAACKTLADALEAAWEKPDQDLVVTIDGQTFQSLTQAGHTGMNGQPSWALIGTHRSKKSRVYRCRVTLQRPATLTGKAGRQSASWSITHDDVGIRTLAVRAVYTALPGVGAASVVAAADFEFPVTGYVAGIKTTLTGEWEEALAVEVERDQNDKLATCTASYREIIAPQSGAGTNDARIVSPQYDVTTFRSASAQLTGANASEPVSITVSFAMGLRLSQVPTDELQQTVEDVVIPHLTTLVQQYSNAPSSPRLVEKSVVVSPMGNRASGACTFVAFGTSLVRASLRTIDYEYLGNAFTVVADGKPFSRDHHPSPGIKRRRIVYLAVELAPGSDLALRALKKAKDDAIAAGFWLIDQEAEEEAFERRIDGGDAVRFVEHARGMNFEYVEISQGGATPPSTEPLATKART